MRHLVNHCDFHAFDRGLFVGAAYPCAAATCIASVYNVSAIVDLREEACDDGQKLARLGVDLLHLPTPDLEPVSPPMLRLGVEFVTPRLDAGETVLIHCQYGIGDPPCSGSACWWRGEWRLLRLWPEPKRNAP